MKMRLALTLYFLFLSVTSVCQTPLNWEKSYGGSADDGPNAIIQTADNSYIIAGYTYSNDGDVTGLHGMFDAWLIKIDTASNLVWQKALGGSAEDNAFDLLELPDGSIVVAGFSASQDGDVSVNKGGFDAWIFKLSSQGNIIWEKSFGGSDNDFAYGLHYCMDGNILVAGSSASDDGDLTGNFGQADAWIIKIDTSGNMIWQNNFGGIADDILFRIAETSSGKIIAIGSTFSGDSLLSGNHGLYDILVYSFDASGNLLDHNCVGGSENDQGSDMILVDDLIYITGISHSNDGDLIQNHGSADVVVLNMDTSLNVTAISNFGGSDYDFGKSIVRSFISQNIVAAYTLSNDGDVGSNKGGTDLWLAAADDNGNLAWTMTMGGSANDYADESIIDSGNRLIVAGTSNSTDGDISNNMGGYDFWILQFKGSATGIKDYTNLPVSVQVSPNPSSDYIHVNFPLTYSGGIRIIDSLGRLCSSIEVSSVNHVSIPLSNLSQGCYSLLFESQQIIVPSRFIKY